MAFIWSYLRRYPKWLAMNFTAAILFVIANLGLPTVLARMIDEGINRDPMRRRRRMKRSTCMHRWRTGSA